MATPDLPEDSDPSNDNNQSKIPTSKIQRATRFVKAGVKVGGNYVKHYAKKIVDPSTTNEQLHEDNAKEVFNALSELKGSALKVAQMMSMQDGLLPKAFADKFQQSQFSVPPLSTPLIVQTFKRQLGHSPFELFDSFSKDALFAASIGQVHEAYKDGKHLAVKIQYPGVGESVSSDLKIARPFAAQIFNISDKDVDVFFQEIEEMLLAETDYSLELSRGQRIASECSHIPHLVFPVYFPEWSSSRILTMDWLEGVHLEEFMSTNPSQEIRNQVGQALWDFYDFQIHKLQEVHADPHPGNFLIKEDGTVGVIDFGCVKKIPQDYYQTHFQVLDPEVLRNPHKMEKVFLDMLFVYPDDSPEEKAFFSDIFLTMLELTTRPFHSDFFDFGDKVYFDALYAFGEDIAKMDAFRKSEKARGSRHALYINRTYFGLYFILHRLKAKVKSHTLWLQSTSNS